MLWLDKNENSDPAMTKLLVELAQGLEPDCLWSYPELGPLYRKLSGHAGVPPECLFLAAGSDGAIRSVFAAFVGPGDVVIHTGPTFAMYGVYCAMFGARVERLDYAASQGGPVLDAGEIVRRIEAALPKLVCLPNPDSPTGTVMAPDDLREITEAAGAAGAVMLIDEAYYPFYEETALPWVQDYPHLIVTRSFGKAWAAAGLRAGYAAASPALAALLHKVRPMYEIGALTGSILARLLDHEAEMRASVARLNQGKADFLTAMNEMSFRTLVTHGNFLHVAFGDKGPGIHEALADKVYYRQSFSEPCLSGFSRFSATTPERFAPIIRTIESVRA